MLENSLDAVGTLRLDLLLRLLLAATLGGAVGLEREISGKPAGLRTNLLICVGAALLTELSILVARVADPMTTNADPARVAAQIVSGIGFLGAGTIIQARGSVVGLTTAATLWVVAAIGMAVGAQAYMEAIGTTLLVIIALILLGRVEDHLISQRAEHQLRVSVEPKPELLRSVEERLGGAGFRVETLEVEKSPDAYTAFFRATGAQEGWRTAKHQLLELPGVLKVSQF